MDTLQRGSEDCQRHSQEEDELMSASSQKDGENQEGLIKEDSLVNGVQSKRGSSRISVGECQSKMHALKISQSTISTFLCANVYL
jgi:hypothetical protein